MSKDQETLLIRIQHIPHHNEWWKQSTRETYQERGIELLKAGLPVKKVAEILESLYWAALEEFGE